MAARSLKGIVHCARAGSSGFDTESKLTTSTARALASRGFQFVIRYLSLEKASPGDLTSEEARQILKAGLGLMAIQHAPRPGWQPSEQLGAQHGRHAVENARSAGLPEGMGIWLRLDGIDSEAAANEITDYCNGWFDSVSTEHYVPGLCVSARPVLHDELISNLRYQYYWKSGGDGAQPNTGFDYGYPVNGYCMIQGIGSNQVDNVTYHGDAVQTDNCGNTPLWLARRPGPAKPATKSGSRRMMAAILAVILAYAAGLITIPQILPRIQSALASRSAR